MKNENLLSMEVRRGLKVLPDIRPGSFTMDEEIEASLKKDDQTYENPLNWTGGSGLI